MKKKILALGAAMCVLLTGCAKNDASTLPQDAESGAASAESAETSASGAENSAESEKSLDLHAVYQAIIDAQDDPDGLVMFEESNPELINSYYVGLSDVEIDDMLLCMPPVTGFACEIMLIKASDGANAEKAEQVFANRIKRGENDGCEAGDVWQTNAQVQRSGLYVCMVALPTEYTIPDDVFSLV